MFFPHPAKVKFLQVRISTVMPWRNAGERQTYAPQSSTVRTNFSNCLTWIGKIALVLTALSPLGAEPAFAHHSFAMFDNTRTVTLEGTIKSFEWENPHSWIQLMVVDSSGKQTEWSIEAGGVAALTRMGFIRTSLNPGDKAFVVTHPLKDGTSGGSLVSVSVNGHLIQPDDRLQREVAASPPSDTNSGLTGALLGAYAAKIDNAPLASRLPGAAGVDQAAAGANSIVQQQQAATARATLPRQQQLAYGAQVAAGQAQAAARSAAQAQAARSTTLNAQRQGANTPIANSTGSGSGVNRYDNQASLDASACLHLDTVAKTYVLRNSCGFGVTFEYCAMPGRNIDNSFACGSGMGSDSAPAGGWGNAAFNANLENAVNTPVELRWFACRTDTGQDPIPKLDSYSPPTGRCMAYAKSAGG